MNIDPAITGVRLKEYRCTLTWRQTMNYAAAIHDHNPWYFDDERAGGIIAHPMQAVAITWPIFEHFQDFIPEDGILLDALLTQVHYTEHLCFHRPLKPGDELMVQGQIAAILPHRAGTHVVIRLDAFDSTGALVFTEHNGGMIRGVTCSSAGQGEQDLPVVPQPHSDMPAIWEAGVHIDPLTPFIYDGCTNIFFPIHTSVQFAHAVGLPNIILQGTATLALAVREIINREAAADPRCLKTLSCRFSGMVLPGEDIVVQLNERRRDPGGKDLFFSVQKASGGKAVSRGFARIEDAQS
ncbi:MAG TPA: MaoC/PaaZ C-terminal domain-containing protein [Desulfomonilia bacterium]|nr:MaoC/PaaZ C-terminal domain-containing protein [Desulfomonilia bacterium]